MLSVQYRCAAPIVAATVAAIVAAIVAGVFADIAAVDYPVIRWSGFIKRFHIAAGTYRGRLLTHDLFLQHALTIIVNLSVVACRRTPLRVHRPLVDVALHVPLHQVTPSVSEYKYPVCLAFDIFCSRPTSRSTRRARRRRRQRRRI